jgi:uncharacterized protein
MWVDFSEYIINNYKRADKIVEVGAGSFLEVALTLKEHLKMDIMVTDVKPGEEITRDDIRHPDLKIYDGAALIYAIRPPEELHPHLVDVAERVSADLIIRPFSTDSINSYRSMELVNYKKAIFYKMCNHEVGKFKFR